MSDREGSPRERTRSDPTERDRTLSRVRTTTAVTGIGAVLVGGALAGWLGHVATPDAATPSTSDSSGSSSSSSDGSSSGSSSDDGLTGPATAPESGSGGSDTQPGVTSGGS
jgi:cytoskeletal protein RodZ